MTATAQSYILFDLPEEEEVPRDHGFLEQLGHPVLVCHGPTGKRICPILAGEPCELAEGAHGIVFELDLERPQHRAILSKYKEALRSDLPIRVVVRPGQSEKYRQLLHGLKVLNDEPVAGDLDGLAAEVEAADM